jgi:hypothetical protein
VNLRTLRGLRLRQESPARTSLTRFQGAYYLATGLWPIVHYRSFELLSGHKRERWLVRTVGLLAAAIGLTLLRRPRESGGLADGTAGAFVVADLMAVSAGQLPTYLADAALETALVVARRVAD